MEKLGTFFKHSNCPTFFKITVYDAVVRAKLLYGIESIALNPKTRESLNIFHLKGLRQILKMDTTFVNKSNSNEKVFTQAANHMKKNRIVPLADVYDTRRIDLLIKLMLQPRTY